MKILTVDNTVYEIDNVPDEIDDIRFGVFDTSDPEWMDYYFLPLIFKTSAYFNSSSPIKYSSNLSPFLV